MINNIFENIQGTRLFGSVDERGRIIKLILRTPGIVNWINLDQVIQVTGPCEHGSEIS
jgi:hypothetical protein